MRRHVVALAWFLVPILLYVVVAMIVFAFRHPELTDTQRFLRFDDAMRWR